MDQLKQNIIGELIFLAINVVKGVQAFFMDVVSNINAAINSNNDEIDYQKIK